MTRFLSTTSPPGPTRRGLRLGRLAVSGALIVGLLPLLPTAAGAAAATTSRVSLTSTGGQGKGGPSDDLAFSADGRYVAFASKATNLVSNDTNAASDVFLRDTVAGTTQRISVATDGAQSNGASDQPAISADGTMVAYRSVASNLVPVDTNGVDDVFVRNMVTGVTTLASVSSGGIQGNKVSDQPALNGDGHLVAFHTLADNLLSTDTQGQADIYLRDLRAGTTERVSQNVDGGGPAGPSLSPSISADGRYVAFTSFGFNITLNSFTSVANVYLRDRLAGTNVAVSLGYDGKPGNNESSRPQISSDGSTVVWRSLASNLVPGDTNGLADIFVRSLSSPTITRLSVGAGGAQADGASDEPAIDGRGRIVAFRTAATNLTGGPDTNGFDDVIVVDRQQGTTTTASVSETGAAATAGSTKTAVSQDGRRIGFRTTAALVASDTNGAADLFVRDLGVLADPDLVTTMTSTPNPAVVGAPVTQNVTVTNAGTATATSTRLDVPVPAGATFVSASGSGACALGSGSITCQFGTLAVGAGVSAQIVLTYGSVGTLITTATASRAQADLTPANDAASTSTPVSLPDLGVRAAVAANPVDPAGEVIATATVTNTGVVAAAATTVSLPVPAGASITAADVGATACAVAQTTACSLGTLAPGASGTATFHLTSAEQVLSLPFSASSSTSDLQPADNVASVTVTVGRPDLTVSLTDSADPVAYQATFTYTARVSNHGTAPATMASVHLSRPAGTEDVAASGPAGACALDGDGVTCAIGLLPVGGAAAAATYTLRSIGAGTTSLTATTSPLGQNDRSTIDDQASEGTTLLGTPAPDLGVVVQLGPNPTPLSGTLTATATVTNTGSAVATQARLALPATAGAYVTGASVSGAAACALTAAEVTCPLGDLAPGDQRTIVATLQPTAEQTISVSPTVASADVHPANDQNTTNDTATASAVVGSPDLAATVVPNPPTTLLGGTSTATVTVRNNGTAPALDSGVVLPVPDGTQLLYVTGPGCSSTPGQAACALGGIPVGASQSFTATFQPSTVGSTTLAATPSLVGGQADRDGSNDVGRAILTTIAPDLAAALTAGPNPLALGGTLTYSATVTNNGTAPASAAVLRLAVPGTAVYLSGSAPGGPCTLDAGVVSCPVGDLAVGTSGSVSINVMPQDRGVLTGTAVVSSATADTGSGDNTASAAVTVTAVDLVASILNFNDYVIVGQVAKYQVTVTNAGTTASSGTSLTLPAPAGATITTVNSGSASGISCAGTAPAVCSLPNIPPGSMKNVTVSLRADQERLLGPSASVSSGPGPDDTPADNNAASTIKATTVSETSVPAWQANGKVDDIVKVGGTLYISGEFTSVRPPRAPAGTGEVARGHAASLDAATGALGSWNPGFDDFVNTMVLSPNGSTLYVGGDFKNVGGVGRNHAAAFDAVTGALLPWNPGIDGPVHALAVSQDGQSVYAGGGFARVGTLAQGYAAKMSAITGAPDPAYAPVITYPLLPGSTMVRSVAVSWDGLSVYVGGVFTTVNGQSHQSIVKTDAVNGTSSATWDPGMEKKMNRNESQVYVIVPTADKLFVCGDFYKVGGTPSSNLVAVDTATGQRRTDWVVTTDGAVNACAVSAGRVYVGGHFDYFGGINADRHTNTGPVTGELRHHLASADITTGEVSLWDPAADSTAGIYALLVTPSFVYAGGDFSKTGHFQVQAGFAMFPGVP